jgi:hypothetical protein
MLARLQRMLDSLREAVVDAPPPAVPVLRGYPVATTRSGPAGR